MQTLTSFARVLAVTVLFFTPARSLAAGPERTDGARKQSDAVRLGAYTSAGFPALLSVGGGLTFSRTVTLGFEYGFLPMSNVGGVDVSYRSYAGDLRVFPGSGPFFFGARVGRQHLATTVTRSAGTDATVSGGASGDGWFVNPRMGVAWTASWGLSVAMDAGVRVPLSHRNEQSAPSGVSLPSSATDTVDLFVAKVIPTVTILQLGLVF